MSFLKRYIDPAAINNNRLGWIDYAKGIAITLVVYRHVLIGLSRAGIEIDPGLFITTHIGLTFRMPLFFLLSGIFFQKSILKRSKSGYLTHKLKTIMYPYFVWSIIQMSLQMILIDYTNAQFASLTDFFLILYKPIAQFWFLYALFNVSILYLLLNHIVKYKSILFIIGVILFYFAPEANSGKLVFDIMRLFVFFVTGDIISTYLLNEKHRKFLTSPYLFIPLFLVAIIGEYIIVGRENDSVLILLLFAFVGSSCTINFSFILSYFNIKMLDIIRIIGYHSLYIFMLHAIVSAAFRIIMINFFHVNHVPFLLAFGTFFGVVGPVIFHSISLRIGLWFLFSPSKPQDKIKFNQKIIKN